MDEITGNLVQGSMSGTLTAGASLVAARVGTGLYTDGLTGEIDYGDHYTECCQNPDFCTQGITFAMWIKRDVDDELRAVLSTGGTYLQGKGKMDVSQYCYISF